MMLCFATKRCNYVYAFFVGEQCGVRLNANKLEKCFNAYCFRYFDKYG